MVSAPRCPPGARGLLALLLLLPLPGARGLCGALPRLSRAVPRDTSRTEGFPIGTEVTYKCLNGDVKIPGKSDTVVCLENSEWSTFGEFCNGGCGAPPKLKSAILREEDGKKNYCPRGTTVSYVCRPGYESTELRLVITCLENLTWSEAPEFCRAKSCGVPKGPEHGRAVVLTNDLYGARANVICDDGFRLCGRPFIQCLLNGDQVEWSQLPTCQAVTCSPPPNITNGSHNGSNMEIFVCNSSVTYKCDNNFLLTGEASIQCTTKDNINGVWNGSAPECKAIPCPPPPDITHGSLTGQSEQEFSFGSVVTYKCDEGFSLIGKASIHCTTKDNVNGEWSGPAPECKASCGAPPRLKSATLSKEDGQKNYSPPGSTVSYVCRPGYESTKVKPVIICLENLTWSEAPEFCRVTITQDKPTAVPPEGTEVAGTSSVTITQDKPTAVPPEGTEVAGTSSDTPEEKAALLQVPSSAEDGREGTEEGVGRTHSGRFQLDGRYHLGTCDSPPRLSFAELPGAVNNSYPVGTKLKYSCRPGYVLGSGKSPLVTCLENSTWSVDPEFCVGRSCKQLELENGRVDLTDLRFGATATFSCNGGYRLIGTTSVQCVVVGNGVDWDKELPHCDGSDRNTAGNSAEPEGGELGFYTRISIPSICITFAIVLTV